MYSSMWFMSIVALLVVDVRTRALQQPDLQPRRCNHCAAPNSTECDETGIWSTIKIKCPNVRQLCATVAVAPDFVSSLVCSAATDTPCSIDYTSEHALKLTCVCSGHTCNTPFSQKLRNALLNFSSPNTTNVTELNESFFIFLKASNVSNASFYKTIRDEAAEMTDMPMRNLTEPTNLTSATVNALNTPTVLRHPDKMLPKPEALKQAATVPSEDDEDEGEGSGSYEDARSHVSPASAPAAPSSFLPANENKACSKQDMFIYLLLTPLFLCIII